MKSRGRTNQLHGVVSEDAAARLYEQQGGKVLARRALTDAGEIDLIVLLGEEVVFVEVKASKNLETAAHALSPRQIARIGLAAEIWLSENEYRPDQNMRFDLVVTDRAGGSKIIENALSFDI